MTDKVEEIKNKFICVKCDFNCDISSRWEAHIKTILHQTGQRKKRSDYKEPIKCDKCVYETKNKMIMFQHKLNEHSTKEEREKKFKYYCKNCDYGSISKDLYEKHLETQKHKKYVIRNND
jgi:hypothetical protein